MSSNPLPHVKEEKKVYFIYIDIGLMEKCSIRFKSEAFESFSFEKFLKLIRKVVLIILCFLEI